MLRISNFFFYSSPILKSGKLDFNEYFEAVKMDNPNTMTLFFTLTCFDHPRMFCFSKKKEVETLHFFKVFKTVSILLQKKKNGIFFNAKKKE